MVDDDRGTGPAAADAALRRSLANLTNSEDLWPFVIGVLKESAQSISASSAAIFLFDEASNRLRTATVLEEGRRVDFFKEDRFIEFREPFEVGHSAIWQELVTGKSYQWRDLTDETGLSFKWLIPWYRRLGLKGGLAVLLMFNARPIGLAVYGCRRCESPPSDLLDSVKNQIHEAAVAIHVLQISHRARDADMAHNEVRAAGEVHESVAQSLAAISMHLAGAQSCLASDPAKAAKAIDKARELARLGIQLVRRTTQVLRPSHSSVLSSSRTVVDFIREAASERGLICDFREIGQIPRTICPETEKGLLQISREAINNAIHHGQPRKLEAVLTWYADRVRLEITDDGAGFDMNQSGQNSEGYGIKGMRDCAAEQGGTLDIVSRIGQGTRICMTLPILNV